MMQAASVGHVHDSEPENPLILRTMFKEEDPVVHSTLDGLTGWLTAELPHPCLGTHQRLWLNADSRLQSADQKSFLG
jgi:hypothetical protein